MNLANLAGTGSLVAVSLRRDRVLAGLWGLVLVAMAYASAAATASLYPSVRDQVAAAEAINASPAVLALYGPVLDVHSLGELAMTKMTVLYAVFVAALFVVLVRRHTRTEEESGRTELLGGTAVGRDAPLAAALLQTALVAVVVGSLTAVANTAGGLPLGGSVAFGASWTAIGLVGAGVSALACQLSASARTCGAFAAGALGAAYLVRAVGDATDSWVSWLSPFGWGTQLRAYSSTRWWVLGLYAALTVVLVALAQVLRSRRDLGSGLVAARPGRDAGGRRLVGPFSLAARTHAAALTVWTVATATTGSVLGAVVPNVSDLLDSSSARALMERLGGVGAVERTLVGAELSVVAVVVAGFGIAVLAHTASDEEAGRTDLVLATAVPRSRVYTAAAVVALGGVAWLLLVAGLCVGTGYGVVGGDLGRAVSDVLPAALVQAPAAWVVVGVAACAFAFRATWTVAGWGVLATFVTLGQVGEALDLPRWSVEISPFAHTPNMPATGFSAAPVLALTAIAVVLVLLGRVRHGSRDLG